MFHMTLLYEMQLLDELPMVWGSSYMVYCLYKVQIEPHQKTPKMAFAMISYSMAVTIVYLIGMFICELFINLYSFLPFGGLISIFVYVLAAQTSANQAGPTFKTVRQRI